MSNSVLLKSSLVKKYWMSATGLFLCLFLVGHLAGNLQLFMTSPEGKLQFNAYAKFMTSNPLVKLLSYLTYISILFHAVDGLMLTIQNRKARPVGYSKSNPGANSVWASRNMGLLGTVILVFISTHMVNFWAKMHFTELPMDAAGNKDLYTIVYDFFKDDQLGMVWVAIYTVSMFALGFHLSHGFKSAFQSVGINHPKWSKTIHKMGMGFAIVVPGTFAIIPIYIAFI